MKPGVVAPRLTLGVQYSMTEVETQVGERLVDKSPSGKVRPWDVHKPMNELLSVAYDEVDGKKADRLRDCATWLEFTVTDMGKKLTDANFCRVRLCPTCMWRRSLKLQAQVHSIMKAIANDAANGGKEYAYTYLTLTIRNVEGDKLTAALDQMNRGFQRLMQTKEIKDAIHGYMKSVEVTHNVTIGDEWYDTYHPHMHALLAVNPSYFKSRYYVSHPRWIELWQKAMRLDYEPDVRIQKVKGNTAKAVAELAGYGTKSDSFIIPDDWDLTVDTVRLLDAVLANRRFVAFGGVFKEYHKKLKLKDPEDGDLIHINEDEPAEVDPNSKKIYYAWFSGYRQYRQVEG